MPAENRRHPRQPLQYPANIDAGDGLPLRLCWLRDISKSGARIAVHNSDRLPNRFSLLLAKEHQKQGAARRCKVVWRDGNQLGLEFIKQP